MNGVELVGRTLCVDHKKDYKSPKDKELNNHEPDPELQNSDSKKSVPKKLDPLLTEHDLDQEEKLKQFVKDQRKNEKKEKRYRKLMERAFSQDTTLTMEELEEYLKRKKNRKKKKKKKSTLR
eukprot:TRINITY_DN11818_c0_g1_i1.p1 TRINITY_DN11818_c0_g1~~TRINITY_DN11818_c0_g1_i1.p1  ORF type:complete len:122 (+),score=35.51 TRINITY_DN11818_c0_g1_i1:792-1157(+)